MEKKFHQHVCVFWFSRRKKSFDSLGVGGGSSGMVLVLLLGLSVFCCWYSANICFKSHQLNSKNNEIWPFDWLCKATCTHNGFALCFHEKSYFQTFCHCCFVFCTGRESTRRKNNGLLLHMIHMRMFTAHSLEEILQIFPLEFFSLSTMRCQITQLHMNTWKSHKLKTTNRSDSISLYQVHDYFAKHMYVTLFVWELYRKGWEIKFTFQKCFFL